MIETLANAFSVIEGTSSKTGKETLLKQFSTIEGFQDVLKFAFDPYIITGLSKKKISKKVKMEIKPEHNFTTLAEMMNYLHSNNSGRDYDIKVAQNCISNLSPAGMIQEFAKQIIIKDLKVGITSSTINKVFGKNYIPKYDVMLAKKYEEHADKLKGIFQVSLKLDGIRCTVFNEISGPKFFSRQGHPIEGLVELEHLFKQLPTGFVYDGELIAVNEDNLTSDDLFRYTQKIVRTDGIKKDVEIVLFDMLPIDEFHAGKSKLILKERVVNLAYVIFSLANNANTEDEALVELIKQVPVYYVGDDKEEIYKILDEVTSNGYEGLMVSPVNSYYETKRTNSLLKVKKFETADLRILGFEEHKHGDKLGSFIVDYKGYEVNVGSGFSDAERESFWNKRHELIGTIVEVGYFEESANQNGGISLRFPTFKHLRNDKTTPSYN